MQTNQKEVLPPLCPEQEEAVKQIVNTDKRAVILTGAAGSGKSVLMKTLLQRYPDKFTITSTTARSALHVGGVTVDSFFSMHRDTWSFRKFDRMERNLREAGQFVIIDEASMVGTKMAELIMTALDHCKKQVVLCGDWAQASPVKDSWPTDHELFQKADIVFLKESHRQSDNEFLCALNAVRRGKLSGSTHAFFQDKVIEPDEDFERDAVKMYATNDKVNKQNEVKLWQHVEETGAEVFTLRGDIRDERPEQIRDAWPLTSYWSERYLEMSPVAHGESFAPGCRVIVTHNIPNPGFRGREGFFYLAVNGDTGTLVGIDDVQFPTCLQVRLDRTGEIVEIPSIELDVYGFSTKTPDYVISGCPLRLGYAITIHKSQGMTLERVEMDTKSILNLRTSSRHGLAYVGLSRAKTPEGLALINWIRSAVYSDPAMAKLVEAAGYNV